MDSIIFDRFWFWFGLLLVILDLVVILRALAASSFGVRTFRDHHSSLVAIRQKWILCYYERAIL